MLWPFAPPQSCRPPMFSGFAGRHGLCDRTYEQARIASDIAAAPVRRFFAVVRLAFHGLPMKEDESSCCIEEASLTTSGGARFESWNETLSAAGSTGTVLPSGATWS